MLKKTSLVLALVLLASGCTREVYLQKVPCVDCEPCVEPCTELTPACCPELAVQTEIQYYQVYDYPPQPVTYSPCGGVPMKHCRTTCKEVPLAR